MTELFLVFMALGFWSTTLALILLVKTVNRLVPYRPEPMETALGTIPMPEEIRALIDMESEDWAKQDLEIEALMLYDKTDQDWARVHALLIARVGEPPAQEAIDDAWGDEPKVTEADGSSVQEGF